jgi:hypothetical protein
LLFFSHSQYPFLRRKEAARHPVGNRNAAALAMSAVATFPHTVLLPRLAPGIAHRKIAPLKTALPKAVRQRLRDPKKVDRKKVDLKRDALNKIIVLSAIAPIIPKSLMSITMTRGSDTIPAALTNTTTWIIRGNTAASLEGSAAATSIVLAEETAIASGSITGFSASRHTITITPRIGTGTMIRS